MLNFYYGTVLCRHTVQYIQCTFIKHEEPFQVYMFFFTGKQKKGFKLPNHALPSELDDHYQLYLTTPSCVLLQLLDLTSKLEDLQEDQKDNEEYRQKLKKENTSLLTRYIYTCIP